MKPIVFLLIACSASFLISSCATPAYTSTDGVYYNPKKDKKKLDTEMGKYPEVYVAGTDRKNAPQPDDRFRQNQPETPSRPERAEEEEEIDTRRFEYSPADEGDGQNITNNYYGNYYEDNYDEEEDYSYTRRINTFYYPSTNLGYYSSWSLYGGNGFYVNSFVYDPWFGLSYNYGYQTRWGGSISYGYNPWGRGFSYGYNNWNVGYGYCNPWGWNRSYWGGYGYGYNNYSYRNRQNHDHSHRSNRVSQGSYGPRGSVYSERTSPSNGLRREIPQRREARTDGAQKSDRNQNVGLSQKTDQKPLNRANDVNPGQSATSQIKRPTNYNPKAKSNNSHDINPRTTQIKGSQTVKRDQPVRDYKLKTSMSGSNNSDYRTTIGSGQAKKPNPERTGIKIGSNTQEKQTERPSSDVNRRYTPSEIKKTKPSTTNRTVTPSKYRTPTKTSPKPSATTPSTPNTPKSRTIKINPTPSTPHKSRVNTRPNLPTRGSTTTRPSQSKPSQSKPKSYSKPSTKTPSYRGTPSRSSGGSRTYKGSSTGGSRSSGGSSKSSGGGSSRSRSIPKR